MLSSTLGLCGIGDPACDYAMAWTSFISIKNQDTSDELKEDMVDDAKLALWTCQPTMKCNIPKHYFH